MLFDQYFINVSQVHKNNKINWPYLERETGFEPATFALARQRSTTELFPR